MTLHREGCGNRRGRGGAGFRNNPTETPARGDPRTVADMGIARRAYAVPDRSRAKAGDDHLSLTHATGRAGVQANCTGRSRWEPLQRRRLKGYAFSSRAESH
jgi:hypothetical protein